MVANALRAGKKLTAAQKANFTAKEISSIRSGIKPVSASAKASRAASLATGKASLRGSVKGLTGVKKAGKGLGRRRATKISGAGGGVGRRETAVSKRKYAKKGTGAGKNTGKRRGT